MQADPDAYDSGFLHCDLLVIGGGAALVHASHVLADLDVSGDEATGVELVREALSAPLYWIARNAGAEGSVVTAVICLAAAVWLGVRVVRRRQVVAPMWTRRARQKQALAAGRTPDAASLDAKQRRALDSVAGGRLEAVGQQDAALDGQRHAGDPRGVVGGQEQQRIGDV